MNGSLRAEALDLTLNICLTGGLFGLTGGGLGAEALDVPMDLGLVRRQLGLAGRLLNLLGMLSLQSHLLVG